MDVPHSAHRADSGELLVLDELLSFMDDVELDAHQPPHATPPMMPPTAAAAAPSVSPAGDVFDHRSTVDFDSAADAEAILDALAFPTDSSDDDLSLLSSSTEPAPLCSGSDSHASLLASSDAPTTALKKRRRRRQKEELDYLRVRVKELEDELNRLRGEDIASSAMAIGTARALNLLPAMKPQATGDDGDGDDACAPQQSREAALALLWERVAQQQKEATQQAVLENIKLRAMVEGQLAVARSLENGLRKRPRIAVHADASPWSPCDRNGRTD
ncbi:hypothetical protein PINS_up012559 [Pythium insidiosum]|nr:hypothetical protein PINS_up012559 [Pythium insidiosum]